MLIHQNISHCSSGLTTMFVMLWQPVPYIFENLINTSLCVLANYDIVFVYCQYCWGMNFTWGASVADGCRIDSHAATHIFKYRHTHTYLSTGSTTLHNKQHVWQPVPLGLHDWACPAIICKCVTNVFDKCFGQWCVWQLLLWHDHGMLCWYKHILCYECMLAARPGTNTPATQSANVYSLAWTLVYFGEVCCASEALRSNTACHRLGANQADTVST